MHNSGSVAGAVRTLFFFAFGLLTHHDDSALSLRAWCACSRYVGGPVRLLLSCFSGWHIWRSWTLSEIAVFFACLVQEYLVSCVSVISKSPSSPRGTGDVEAIIVIPRVYRPNA